MKTIVIVSQAPLTPQIKRNSYIDEYISLGYKVYFWDVSQIIHYGMRIVDEIEADFITKFNSISEIESKYKSLNTLDSIFIFDFDPSWKTRKIFKVFKNPKYRHLRIDMYGNTCLKEPTINKFKKLLSADFKRLIYAKANFISYKYFVKSSDKFKFDGYLSSSKYSARTNAINHPDYDEFLANQGDKIQDPSEPFILFIDTFFGRHPDFKFYYNSKLKINIDAYYSSLNALFDYLEKKYNLPVVIAAHPKAFYEDEIFHNRKVVKYQTFQLIHQAKYVIAQVCNTFSWISLMDKPVALISTNEYIKVPHLKHALNVLSNTFHLNVYNIDRVSFNDISFKNIDAIDRDLYKYSYLTTKETELKLNINLLQSTFEKI